MHSAHDRRRRTGRLEHLLDLGYAGWRERQRWRRQGLANGRSGALEASRRAMRPAGRVVR